MEFCSGGSLADLVTRQGALDEEVVQWYTVQMLQGLAYLHSRGVLHRDLKPNNVLLASSSDGETILKLADFGCSKTLEGTSATATNAVGTIAYCAPEVLRPVDGVSRTRYGYKADIWSLGMTVLELLTGVRPFSDSSNVFAIMYRLAMKLEGPEIPDSLSADAKDFLHRCLEL